MWGARGMGGESDGCESAVKGGFSNFSCCLGGKLFVACWQQERLSACRQIGFRAWRMEYSAFGDVA